MDASSLVSAFYSMMHELSGAFTQPTAETFRQLVTGWLMTPHPGAITCMIRTLGSSATKHWTVYEKFFYRAAWSPRKLSMLLLVRLIAPLLGDTILLAIDETTCGPRGKHVALAGWCKDASAHAKGKVFHWAHQWVVGAVIIRPDWRPGWRLSLPVLFEMYRKISDADAEHPHRTLQQIARQMVCDVARALPNKRIIVAVDGLYAAKTFFGNLPPNVAAVSRLRKDAALRSAIAPPSRGQRRRIRGERLGSLDELASVGKRRTATLRKQGRTVDVRMHGLTCQWYHVCHTKPVRVVFVEDPTGREDSFRAVCSDPTMPDEQIVQTFYDRWGIEECFQESKQQMGMERTRGWSVQTVTRQAPLAMLINTLVKLWYLKHVAQRPDLQPETPPWYTTKVVPSYRDMLATLRRALWEERLKFNSRQRWKLNDLSQSLLYALCQAA
jgi:hypothetical protein